MEKELIVAKNFENLRLDKFLAGQLISISRSKIRDLIKKGAVTVDGRIRKPSFPLHDKQRIFISIEEEKNKLKPYEIEVKIIYEDPDIIVVDKPSGLTVHPPHKNYTKTLVNALIYLSKPLSGMDTLRPGVVHRLDKETSGVMVLAKNDRSQDALVEQFKNRKVEKKYAAIVWGEFKRKRMHVDLPLARDKKNRLKMKVSFLKSKNARTEIAVVSEFRGATYLEISPLTGRMHQIRVHLNFLGFPIVGDKKYGVKDGYHQLFLHAKTLSFHHPRDKKFLTFNSPLPEWFKKFIDQQKVAGN